MPPGSSDTELGGLFAPRAVAVVGASADPAKIGHRILSNIVAGGYRGAVHPVHPSGGERLGRPVVRCLAEIDGPLDLAVLAVPKAAVGGALEDVIRRGVPYTIVIASGYAETGDVAAQQRLVEQARGRTRLLGPNVFGLYSARAALNATFGPARIPAGGVGIVTQSGALGIAMIGRAAAEGVGLSCIVSVGNRCDLDEADLLAALADDPGTRVVLLYVEGTRDGRRLAEALRAAGARQPVVVLKAGRSRRGAAAAASHTGSLAGADAVFDAVLRQCGALRARGVDEAFDWCRFLASAPAPAGERALILTNGGGVGVMAADACEAHDVPLLDDPEALRARFAPFAPSFAGLGNPVDLTGQATPALFARALDAALEEPRATEVVGLICETADVDPVALERVLLAAHARFAAAGKPLVLALFGGAQTDDVLRALRRRGVAAFSDVYPAVSCLGALHRWQRALARRAPLAALPAIDVGAAGAVVEAARAAGQRSLAAPAGRALMAAAGIRLPAAEVARDVEQAREAGRRVGYPVAIKIVSPDILHKTDVGGVALGIDDEAELEDAVAAVLGRCRAARPQAAIAGVEVVAMVAPGLEVIAGVQRDPSFGPVLMFGLGGVHVEVIKDVAFRMLPLAEGEARRLIEDIRAYPLLLGVRGEAPRDVEALLDVLGRVSALALACPGIASVEINPLVLHERGAGAVAIDARVILAPPGEEGR